jgi:hypothetical protein
MTFCFCFFCMSINAQQLDKNNSLSEQIYFDNAVYVLNAEQTKTLDQLAAQWADKKIVMISVSATADQKGKQKANEILANQRATAVRNYLLNKGVPPPMVRIDKCEILPVGINQNNRRANIVVEYAATSDKNNPSNTTTNTTKNSATDNNKTSNIVSTTTVINTANTPNMSPEERAALTDLNSFFAYSAKKYEQKHRLNGKRGKVINGRRGTVIHIPPYAFETLDGQEATGEINIDLQEAHTYGDMILQNLATVSNGEQLETGGMVRIAATDANGQTLRLKKGKDIFVSLPNPNANTAGMLVFTGERDGHENMNWGTDGSPVAVATGLPSPFRQKPNYDINSEVFQKPLRISSNATVFDKPLPKPVSQPEVLNKPAPTRPVLAPLDEPQLSDYYDKFSQNTKESFSQYSIKARKKHKEDHQTYTQKKAAQDKIYQSYRRDSLNHVKLLAQHQSKIDAHQAYIAELRTALQKAGDVEQDIDIKTYAQLLTSVNQTLNNMMNVSDFYTKAKFLSAELTELRSKHPDFEQLINAVDSNYIDRKEFKGLQGFSKEISGFLKSIEKKVEIAERAKLEEVDAETYFAASASYNIARLLRKENWTKQDCDAAIKWINVVRQSYHSDFIKIQAKYSQFIKKNTKVISLCHKKYDSIFDSNEATFNKKIEHGLLTSAEVAEIYRNALTINTLGWINCDRFSRDPSPRSQINILTEKGKDKNTQFYIVFHDIKSVMSASNLSANLFTSNLLPQNQNVTVIGIHVQDQQSEISITKGRVSDLSKIKATFEPKTLKEVQTILGMLS